MTLKKYIIIMSIATIVCWVAFLFVVRTIDPTVTNWIGFTMFYVSLFLAITGTAALVGFLIRFVGLKKELVFRSVLAAFRQSFMFASLIIISLILLSKNLFTWLNIFLLILGLSVLEFFIISYQKPEHVGLSGEYENDMHADLENEEKRNIYNE